MRVCLLFTGHLRTAIRNETLLPHLVEANGNPDIFIHTYRTLNAPTPNWHGDMAGAGVDAAADLAWVLATYPNIRAVKMDPATGGHEYAPTKALAAACPARASCEAAIDLMTAYEEFSGVPYDVVFIARFDLWLGAPLVIGEPEPQTLYGSHLKHDLADGDVFSYGRANVIRAIGGEAFPDFARPIAEGAGQEGERITTALRKACGYEYRVHPVNHGLLRSNGVFVVVP